MKVTNWRRKLAAALFAGGVWVPSMASGQVIPLGDTSFEDFLIGANTYAYADEYRPASAWIDDLDLAGEDDDNSNWLYDAAYAEVTTYGRRGAPRTGNQAMNGGGNYSAWVDDLDSPPGFTQDDATASWPARNYNRIIAHFSFLTASAHRSEWLANRKRSRIANRLR